MGLVKAGDRLRSRVCTTEVIVIRAPGEDVELRCGGQLLARSDEQVDVAANGGPTTPDIVLGKRYSDEARRIELLCVKAGGGPLTMDGEVLSVQTAKPLPASD